MERSRDVLSKIEKYARHCHRLVRDIDHVLQDQQLIREEWTLNYAVDFSEIHSYILPEAEHRQSIDGWVRADAVDQFVTLSRFFANQTLILPEPYARELEAFVRALVSQTITKELGQLVDTYSASNSQDAVEVQRLAAEAEQRHLTDDEIEKVISFFEHNGIILAARARGGGWNALDRLSALLSRRSFISLEEVTGLDSISLDESAVRRSFLELESRRRGHAAANYHDAVVIEQVRAANQLLAPRKQLVLLVTHSIHMADVVDSGYGFVRHPRIFSAMYRPPSGDMADSFLLMLAARREALQLFLVAAQAALGRAENDLPDDRSLSTISSMMSRIQEDWSSGENLASTLTGEGEKENEENAFELLRMLRNRDDLVLAVRGRLAQILHELQRFHSLIGFSLQSESSGGESAGSIPYDIDLEAPVLREHLAAMSKRWTSSLSESLDLLHLLAADAYAEHDVLLSLAACLGAFGHWPVAAKYADLAVRQFSESGKSAYEAIFFASVCRRKSVVGLQRSKVSAILREALHLLDECDASRQAKDPRILHERALLLIALMDEGESVTRDFIASLLHAALALDPPSRLRLQILNSRLVFEIRTHGEAAQALVELQQELSEQFDSRSIWPPLVVDTTIYAAFRLHGTTAPTIVLQTWLEELRSVSAELSPQERVWVDRHLAEINAALVMRER